MSNGAGLSPTKNPPSPAPNRLRSRRPRASLPNSLGCSGKTYHYRFAAVNAEGKGISADRAALTAGAVARRRLRLGSHRHWRQLHGKVDPEALETTYWFEYGPTPEYGTKFRSPGNPLLPPRNWSQSTRTLTGLNGGVYHFRLVAENSAGKTVSEDQTFNFYAQPCPNEILRQETGSEYLPDCRAYELVSPGAAGNVIFVPEHAQPGPLATNPVAASPSAASSAE